MSKYQVNKRMADIDLNAYGSNNPIGIAQGLLQC